MQDNNLIKDMLKSIPDPKQRELYGRVLSGEITREVQCHSEDLFETRDVPVITEEGQHILIERGKNRGQPKMERKEVQVRKGCYGRVIAHITADNKVVETPPLEGEGPNGVYQSGLEGSRMRFDGVMGFRCYCGNSSILAPEEEGIIKAAPPTQDDLQTIAERLQKRKQQIPVIGGKMIVGEFIVQEIKV